VETRVLIIDDASTDNTPEVAGRLADQDPRVSVRRHESNLGHIMTYNEGLEWVDGDYTVLLSSDDLVTPGAFRRAASVMDDRQDVAFVYGRAVRFWDDDVPQFLETPPREVGRYQVRSGPDWIADRCLEGRNCICSPEVITRTTVQLAVGPYNHELPISGDLEMWLRLASRGSVGRVIDAPQALYREHPASMQRDAFSAELLKYQQRVAAFDSFFGEHVDEVSEGPALWRAARRSIARQILWSACRRFDHGEADRMLVQPLIDLAFETYPESATLREYRSLRWRTRIGPQASAALRPVIDAAFLRRPRSWLRWRTRVMRGV
jgi:hypothetical protein